MVTVQRTSSSDTTLGMVKRSSRSPPLLPTPHFTREGRACAVPCWCCARTGRSQTSGGGAARGLAVCSARRPSAPAPPRVTRSRRVTSRLVTLAHLIVFSLVVVVVVVVRAWIVLRCRHGFGRMQRLPEILDDHLEFSDPGEYLARHLSEALPRRVLYQWPAVPCQPSQSSRSHRHSQASG